MKVLLFLNQKSQNIGIKLLILSLITGLLNTSVIAIINLGINREGKEMLPLNLLLIYFLAVYFFSIFFQRFYQSKLIKFTNNLIWDIRLSIIERVRHADYLEFEQFGHANILTILTRDISRVVGISTSIVHTTTSIVTVMGCLVYLAWLDIFGFLITIGIISLILVVYLISKKKLDNLLLDQRNKTGEFFKYLHDFLLGKKEISLNLDKNNDLYENYLKYFGLKAKEQGIKSYISYTNLSLFGQYSFYLVLGIVVFLFPYFGIGTSQEIASYVLVLLFILGPIQSLIQIFPQFSEANIGLERIQELLSSFDKVNSDNRIIHNIGEEFDYIEFLEVEFEYPNSNPRENKFSVGPFNLKLHKGEIIYIVGGNGSGKSTLIKLIAGLYKYTKGSIRFNNKTLNDANYDEYRGLFSTIFTDNYLFKKLYGIEDEKIHLNAKKLIEMVGLSNKVSIENCEFSTISLSEGQKKRLALIQTLLEDKPICIFDEYTSNQDDKFKVYFYKSIIPQLLEAGKTCLIITHEEKYLHDGSKVIFLENGILKYRHV